MFKLLAAAASVGGFTNYPELTPAPIEQDKPKAVIETFTDRGPIYELTIRCPSGIAILSYSKIERVYCVPQGGCSSSLQHAVSRTCGF